MNRLLHAHFARLKKDKGFWIGIIGMFLLGAGICLNSYWDQIKYQQSYSLESFFFAYALLIGIFCSAFCSLYIGTEYSDGTMRNKVIVGHRRGHIYFANLITSLIASLLMCCAFFLAMLVIGIPCFGFFQAGADVILAYLLDSILMVAAFSALFTMLSMLIPNKAVAAIVCVLCFFLLFFLAVSLNSRLDEPEFYYNYVFTDGVPQMCDAPVPNPYYPRGTKRAIYQFFLDFIPTGQGIQISQLSAAHLWQMPIYALSIVMAATTVGMLVFRKKDLK